MSREGRTKPTEIDAFFRKSGKVIVALAVKEILEEQLAKKLAQQGC
jgi:hypothetical protein